MLEKDLTHRPQTMRDVAQELKGAERELRSLGLIQEEGQPLMEHPRGAQAMARRAAIMHTVNTLRQESPDSMLVESILPLIGLERLPQSTFRLMLWGVLERELHDSPLHSERMDVALSQLAHLVKMALGDEDSNLESSPWIGAVGSFLQRLTRDREERLMRTLSPFDTHPRMPAGILPSWASVQATGSWMPLVRPGSADEALSALSGADSLEDRELDLDVDIDVSALSVDSKLPLIEKLRRPVSVKTVRSVLKHDLSTLWRRKDLEDTPSESPSGADEDDA